MNTPPTEAINCRCVNVPILPEWKCRFYRSRLTMYAREVDPISGEVLRRVKIKFDDVELLDTWRGR